MSKCIICGKRLRGKQTKFCSKACCRKVTNAKHQNYEAQQLRGHTRKLELVKQYGSKCLKCGYNKCIAALSFHHRNPKLKNFGIDIRKCSNTKWDTLVSESKKCDLLCMNCHIETHFQNKYDIQLSALDQLS